MALYQITVALLLAPTAAFNFAARLASAPATSTVSRANVVGRLGFVGGGRTLATTVALPPLPALGSASRGERAGAAREVAPVPDRREAAHVNCVPNSVVAPLARGGEISMPARPH